MPNYTLFCPSIMTWDINWYSDLCILSCNYCMEDYIYMLEKGKLLVYNRRMMSINPQVDEFQKESKRLEGKSQSGKIHIQNDGPKLCLLSVGAGEINVLVPSWVSELQPVCRTSFYSLLSASSPDALLPLIWPG